MNRNRRGVASLTCSGSRPSRQILDWISLTATKNVVNGPHSAVVHFDEVELLSPGVFSESVADEAARGISELEAFLAEQPVRAPRALVYA